MLRFLLKYNTRSIYVAVKYFINREHPFVNLKMVQRNKIDGASVTECTMCIDCA